MSFNAENMIQGTEALANTIDSKTDPKEYDYRNYSGRAYYTAYQLVLEFLDKEHNYIEVSVSNGSYTQMGTHKRLTQFLLDHVNIPSSNSNKDYQRLTLRLKDLINKRVHGDYIYDREMKEVDYHQTKTQLNGITKLITSMKKSQKV